MIKYKKCGREFSDIVIAYPNCGYNLTKAKEKSKTKTEWGNSMKKILVLLAGCLTVNACTTLSPEQQRANFESQIGKPVLPCELKKVGARPVAPKVSVSVDEVAYYDTSMCTNWRFVHFIPVQRINAREFLVYPCEGGCDNTLAHFKFPYPIKELEVDTIYPTPSDICLSREGRKPYRYTTVNGLKNTIDSWTWVEKRVYSKAERMQMVNKLQREKQQKEQEKLNRKYEEQKKFANDSNATCQEMQNTLNEEWQMAMNKQGYCKKIMAFLNMIPTTDTWQDAYLSLKVYYNDTCVHKLNN